MNKSREGRAALSEFLVQFARLTGRFVAMDVRTLSLQHKADSDQEPDLASRGYLQAFGFLLRKHESSHIGRNLENHYHWDWNEDIMMLMNNFQAEGGTLVAMARLVRGQLSMMSRNPKIIIECLIDPCRIARKVVDDAAAILEDSNMLHGQYAEEAKQSMVQGFEFFKVMSAGLESIIEKHYTFLTPDAAYNHIESLWMIFRHTLSWENDATREILGIRHRERPELSFRLLPRVISCDWKFGVLKKLICSTQMQLRVVGVTRMCGDLLEIYNGSKIPDPPSNPLLLYFAEFILNHKLVDYLVGTGSHPEIINESNNIVGFLIVTKTYKDQQSDKIWQTVISSQDPRVVEAILKMLRKCLPLMDYQSLLYFCKKVRSLPIEGFTAAAREFCHELFNELVRKVLNESAQPVDSPPYDLCVRLIRQSSIITPECPAGYPDVQNFAAGRFRDLLGHGPSPEARNAIYHSCIEDITARAPTALGSICVINALLRQNIGTDLHTLTTEHGLTKLVVEELQSTILGDRLLSNPSIRNSPASQARRELLLTIIINEPGTISPDLGAQLWSLLVGSESRSVTDRNTSWQILNSAVKKSAPNNVFIASCFRDYLPKLPPDCFTIGALDFAREAISSWLEQVRHDFVEEDRTFESPALEQLWRMIVTAPPNTIDAPAINILVEVYLESQLIMSMPRTKARSIHLTLVDRCLKELAAAATKLKTFNGSNANLDDEAMVLVASEEEFSEQEKIFARSLAVLREFLKAYQLKPRFASPKSKKSPIGIAQSSVKGEPLTVKYQSFDGDTHTEVKSLTLGKLNNATSLIASLQKATGFTNYKVYYGGKLFDPDESNISKSLDDLNLNGLFLVQRREDAEGHSQVNKSSLELDITKHFDELWGYLAMHEKVAQEV
jgi:ubiquitin carboxyl-terminal hydrolase 34